MFIASCKLNTCFVALPAEKFCLKTKNRPGFIDSLGNQVEVVPELKLLGVTIDFLFIIQYQITFIKTFILLHFDYCSSLFIYFIYILYLYIYILLENIIGLYNNCLFHLLDLDFRGKPIDEQYTILRGSRGARPKVTRTPLT
jgi:hypothetical protein